MNTDIMTPTAQSFFAVEDCPEASLGSLSAGANGGAPDGTTLLKGVAIPDNVLRQLRMLGMPLDGYSVGQLMEAVAACVADANLDDDPDGEDFDDKLTLTDTEREEDEGLIESSPFRKKHMLSVELEREKALKQLESEEAVKKQAEEERFAAMLKEGGFSRDEDDDDDLVKPTITLGWNEVDIHDSLEQFTPTVLPFTPLMSQGFANARTSISRHAA